MNPDKRVHGSETCVAIACCMGLLVVLGACAAMIIDAYRG